ncbi:alpha-ketoacid dehydrogenase subunit alpha/beta [Terriglobus aquaticus]|uniref:Dehydrogenase E1 component subunit alpha/beta n=1 Tax=Terriglobus aquaticus TaxID=940139 RepID=A0ABW9KK04_9BACT|nr:dehydrogenase E1 component subunit alpha/beta [Terriglobus aquaticus]
MAGKAAGTATRGGKGSAALSREQWIRFYRTMYLSRRTDDRELLLKKQQKIFFQISGAGHEALLTAAGMTLRPGHDWFFPYYRDRALCLALGQTVVDQLLQAVGAGTDPQSGGRQMPSHWTNKSLNLVSPSSSTATQCLHAVGCAEAGRYFHHHPEAAKGTYAPTDYRAWKDVQFHADEVVYTSIGEGSTSQGEFWEALNSASNGKLPVLFVVEDNGYAISTPVETNTPGGNISRLVANFPNFHFAEIDGTDAQACVAAMQEAAEYVRTRKGPALVHGHVIRPYSHSQSDDERQYRVADELEADALRDPLGRMQAWLIQEGLLTEDEVNALEREVDEEVRAAADQALAAPLPAITSIPLHVYSEQVDPCSSAFSTAPAPTTGTGDRTMADLINATLRDEMRRDERILIFGEDVADASRDQHLKSGALKGKGGVFKLTSGLQAEFGSDRVFNSPLAEANITGRAIGMAVRGLKPVVEIQFFDYIWPAMHQMRNELSVMRWRSNGLFSSPIVMRVPIGGYLTGGSIYHSQSGESIFTHTPGVRVIMPSNALDAAGLLRTAIRCDDPVLFLEHKRLYREAFGRAPYPGPEYMIPFGKAKQLRAGTDLTIVTYGALVPRVLQAAQRLSSERDISTEVLDLRSLSPYDFEAIAESVRRTNRLLIVHEDMRSWGFGAEVAARAAEELFHDLDAPVRRLASMDTFVAYQPVLEDVILPQADDVFRAAAELADF